MSDIEKHFDNIIELQKNLRKQANEIEEKLRKFAIEIEEEIKELRKKRRRDTLLLTISFIIGWLSVPIISYLIMLFLIYPNSTI